MEIGRSGIKTSTLGMGTWAIGGGTLWGANDDRESVDAIHCALDNNVTWIDTAPVYGMGHSEEVVGEALSGRRDRVILSTKCGLHWEDAVGSFHKVMEGKNVFRDLSAKGIRRDLENSLRRLRTDYIDVLYTHWQSEGSFSVPIEETMAELMKMKREGKIRAIGASNVNLSHLEQYVRYGQLDVIQEKYSILDRRLENSLLPFCESNHISVQVYSPLEQGLLTGHVTSETKLNAGDVRNKNLWWKPENRRTVVEMLASWKDLSAKYNCSIGDLVIAWTSRRADSLNVLCGARKVKQVLENVNAESIFLEDSDYERMTSDADGAISKKL